MDPLDYWVGKLNYFSVLAPIACDILVVPASVERIFSGSSEATSGKRNRLTNRNLGRDEEIRNICSALNIVFSDNYVAYIQAIIHIISSYTHAQ